MKIITESYQDVEAYLRGSELVDSIVTKFGKYFAIELNYGEVVTYIEDTVNEMFDTNKVMSERVAICKVVGDDIDLIEDHHEVINYNGTYYDYCAQRFNESFNGLINLSNIPVVQKIVHSDKQITDKLSTIKGYVILGY